MDDLCQGSRVESEGQGSVRAPSGESHRKKNLIGQVGSHGNAGVEVLEEESVAEEVRRDPDSALSREDRLPGTARGGSGHPGTSPWVRKEH